MWHTAATIRHIQQLVILFVVALHLPTSKHIAHGETAISRRNTKCVSSHAIKDEPISYSHLRQFAILAHNVNTFSRRTVDHTVKKLVFYAFRIQ